MCVLSLIGSGFDLCCGMKTRYVDVYNSYEVFIRDRKKTFSYSLSIRLLFDYQLACEQSLLVNDELDSELLKQNAILKSG